MKPVKLFPEGADARNKLPIAALFDYFPLAMIEIAKVIQAGNDQHNPGEPVHWAREKSTNHADKMLRHYMERGTHDSDGTRHSGKMAWRALAMLETECELDQGYDAVAEAQAEARARRQSRCRHIASELRGDAYYCIDCGLRVQEIEGCVL